MCDHEKIDIGDGSTTMILNAPSFFLNTLLSPRDLDGKLVTFLDGHSGVRISGPHFMVIRGEEESVRDGLQEMLLNDAGVKVALPKDIVIFCVQYKRSAFAEKLWTILQVAKGVPADLALVH